MGSFRGVAIQITYSSAASEKRLCGNLFVGKLHAELSNLPKEEFHV